MKRIVTMTITLVLSMLILTSCGKSEFGVSDNTGKLIMITADNAEKESFFVTGSLEVGAGEQITIAGDLSAGEVRVEIISVAEDQDIDNLAELGSEPVLAANISSYDECSGGVPAGTYMVKAECIEKATGSVQIEVKPSKELPEGEVDVVLDEGIEKYEGNWYEEIAGRGYMEIAPSGDGKYYIQVSWGSSAFETAVWNFTAIYDNASGDLSYDAGSYQMLAFDEDGNETAEDEKDVHGVLHLTDEGKIEWTDSAYDSDEPSVFVKE